MLKLVPGHLKTKNICNHAVTKLPYLLWNVLDKYKTQQTCDSRKAIPEDGWTLKSVSDCEE